MGLGENGARALRLRATALLAARARDRGGRAARVRAVRNRRDSLEPAGRRLAVGPLPEERRAAELAPREDDRGRYDMSLPANQAKLDAADKLAALAEEAGLSLVQMALAFVLEHPAVTAAIIGPRTLEQLETQLGAEEIQLDRELLDRIDEIVPPGTTINPVDRGWEPPALASATLRRRSLSWIDDSVNPARNWHKSGAEYRYRVTIPQAVGRGRGAARRMVPRSTGPATKTSRGSQRIGVSESRRRLKFSR